MRVTYDLDAKMRLGAFILDASVVVRAVDPKSGEMVSLVMHKSQASVLSSVLAELVGPKLRKPRKDKKSPEEKRLAQAKGAAGRKVFAVLKTFAGGEWQSADAVARAAEMNPASTRTNLYALHAGGLVLKEVSATRGQVWRVNADADWKTFFGVKGHYELLNA